MVNILNGTLLIASVTTLAISGHKQDDIYAPEAFLLRKNHPGEQIFRLPPSMDYTCELLLTIEVKDKEPTVSPPADGLVIFTVNHPSLEHGSEKFMMKVNGKETRKKKSLCFTKHCEKFIHDTFRLYATTEISKLLDITILPRKGNHECYQGMPGAITAIIVLSSILGLLAISVLLVSVCFLLCKNHSYSSLQAAARGYKQNLGLGSNHQNSINVEKEGEDGQHIGPGIEEEDMLSKKKDFLPGEKDMLPDLNKQANINMITVQTVTCSCHI